MKLLFITINTAIAVSCFSSILPSPCSPTVDQIFNDAKAFHDSVEQSYLANQDALKKVSNYLKYADFNFSQFAPVEGPVDLTSYYEIGFDKDGVMIEINHYEKNPDLNNWRMVLHHTSHYIIIGVEDWTDNFLRKGESYDFLPGFLVYIRATQALYFINTYSLGDMQFKPIFPVFSLNDISYVAHINSKLQMTTLFKFVGGKLLYFSDIKLYPDNRKILEESIYSPRQKDFQLKRETCLSDFQAFADSQRDYSGKVIKVPCVPAENPRFPLWFFAGSHAHCK